MTQTRPDGRVFLDTNIFLYAAGSEHRLKAPCGGILNQVGTNDLDAVTSTEVVQEILNVLSRRDLRVEGLRLATQVKDLLPELLPVTDANMLHTCRLLENHPNLPVRDAVHCSVMLSCGVTRILTADTHFDNVPGIHRVDPADRSFY